MNEIQHIEELAESITHRLHKSLTQLPAELVPILRPFKGSVWRYALTPDHNIILQARILADGGVELQIEGMDGTRLWSAVLHP